MKLNLGAKNTKIEGYTSCDIYEGEGVDVVCDIGKLPFDDCTIEGIYASHCLEHFKRTETERVVSEWFRVLQKGSKLLIAVPNFDAIVDYYNKTRMLNEMLLGLLYGNQNEPYNFHYVSFNYSNLAFLLSKVGFKKINKVENFGILNDCSTITDNIYHKNLSLNLEAVK